MRIKILFLFILTHSLFAQEVKVGIVGYALLDSFKIRCDKNAQVILDGKELPFRSFIIKKSGVFISGKKEIIFNTLEIKTDAVTTFLSHYGEQPYLGDFNITYSDGLTIINRVSRINYLSSVLGSEMGLKFEKEALKAQLLLIKKYYNISKIRNKNRPWDILNTASVMAYRGEAYSNSKLIKIVMELDNINLLLPNNIEPLFFSTASGYLLNQDCFTSTLNNPPINPLIRLDDNKSSPYYRFSHSINSKELLELINNNIPIKTLMGVELKYFKGTNCVDFIGFKDNMGNKYWLKAYKFVSLMQKKYGSVFKSIQFSIYKENDFYHFDGNGFGHFVGLSQFGAQEMALKGKNYIEILQYYFPSSQIK